MRPNNKPHVLLDDALTPLEANALIERATDRGLLPTGAHYPPSYRDNDRLVCEDPKLAAVLLERLRAHLPERIEHDGSVWQLDSINPRFRVCRYRGGQRFRIHRDGVHHCEDGRRSMLTFMVYLNDATEFEGGDTRFFAGRRDTDPVTFRVTPKAGRLIVFDHTIWHDGAPVTAGQKYVLRSDLLYRRVAGRPEAEGHRGYVWKAIPLPCGGVATTGRDKTIRLWNADLQPTGMWRAHRSSVFALAVAPDGTLYSGSRSGHLRAWSPAGELIAEATVDGALLDARWTRWGLITAGADGCIRRWRPGLEHSETWTGHAGWVWRISETKGGLLSAGEDGTVRMWKPDGSHVVLYQGAHPITTVIPLEDGFATGDGVGVVRVHRPRIVRVVADHAARVRDLMLVAPHLLASAAEDDRVTITDLQTDAQILVFEHDDFVTSLAMHRGHLLSTSYDGGVACWELPSEQRKFG